MAFTQNQAINIGIACTTDDLTRFAEVAQGCDINAELIWIGRRIVISGFHTICRTPLMLAASYGSVSVAERILNTPGVDVNRYSSTDNLTALDCLLVYEPLLPRSDAIHRMLLDCGAQYRHPADPGGYVHNTYIHVVRHDNDKDPLGWSCETANFMNFKYKMRRCQYGNRCLGENRCPYLHDWDRERRRDFREHDYRSDPCFFYPHCNNPGCELSHGDCERKFHPYEFRTRVCVEKMMCRTKACSYYHNWIERIPIWRRQPPTFTLDLMPSSSHGH